MELCMSVYLKRGETEQDITGLMSSPRLIHE